MRWRRGALEIASGRAGCAAAAAREISALGGGLCRTLLQDGEAGRLRLDALVNAEGPGRHRGCLRLSL